MKRYPSLKKFLLWFFLLLVLVSLLVIVWLSLERSSSMRPPAPSWEKRQEEKRQEEERRQPLPEREAGEEAPHLALEALVEEAYFGWPASPFQVLEVVEFKAFSLGYHEQHEQAAWVAYRLQAQGNAPRHNRQDRFRADGRVSTGSATPEDYANSGYDRGHLAPAADFSTDQQALKETFYMSNMSPQVPAFNRGIWSKLENQVRAWAETEGDLWVVTGPVLHNQNKLQKIGANQISVPLYYYKVILDAREPELKMIGFVLPNEGSGKDLRSFVLTVDSIEALTGLDFFPMLPDELEERLESQHAPLLWFR
jgi:endonuclease G, mitochondrial